MKILLERLGGLMRDLQPYTGMAREFQLRRDIFFAETYSFLKVPATAIIIDRSRKHLLTLQNGKPIDQPGALDFLMDPTRTGESGPPQGRLAPMHHPPFPASPFALMMPRAA